MGFVRSLTLIWPGMPWLWLRGSVGGLVLAVAFAVVLDVAVITTWIWSELVDLQVSVGIWTSVAAVWLVATVSALASFPPPIPRARDDAADALYVKARDAYLARDWLAAETKLRALLVVAPTDGEAQLLLATLLRRVGRVGEAKTALEKLARSDSGAVWQAAIAREVSRIADAGQNDTDEPPAAIVAIPARTAAGESREKAA